MSTHAHTHVKKRPNDRDWKRDRKFDPEALYGCDIDLNSIQVTDIDEEWTYLACDEEPPSDCCGRMTAHLDGIFIAVDGACRGNGTPQAQAAIGVFVGQRSHYNKSVLLQEPLMTNQMAELQAGIMALEQAMEIRQTKALGEEQLDTVVIKSDSEYLVKGMTEWVFKWVSNGYRNAKRKPVENKPLFEKLHGMIQKLNELGVEVLFWHVPREENKEADALANKAFHVHG